MRITGSWRWYDRFDDSKITAWVKNIVIQYQIHSLKIYPIIMPILF